MRGFGSSTHTAAVVTNGRGETGLLCPARTRLQRQSPGEGSLPGWKEPEWPKGRGFCSTNLDHSPQSCQVKRNYLIYANELLSLCYSSLIITPTNIIFLLQNIELVYHYLNVFSSWVWLEVQIARDTPHYPNLPTSWVLDNKRQKFKT